MTNTIEHSCDTDTFRYLDLSFSQQQLRAESRSLTAADGASLQLRIGGDDGKALLGGAVALVNDVELRTDARRYVPDFLGAASGGKLYCWAGSEIEGQPVALVLPDGWTSDEMDPVADAVAEHEGRLVLAWASAPRRVTWMLRQIEGGSVAAEATRLATFVKEKRAQGQSSGASVRRRVISLSSLAAMLVVGFFAASFYLSGKNQTADPNASLATRGVRQPAPKINPEAGAIYGKSYALVVGIDQYSAKKWNDLSYARHDAEGFAEFLGEQHFDEVFTLYDDQATKKGIIHIMQSELARRDQEQDRVLVFFAGHGHTERLGGKDWGYIVPSDGDEDSASYISMEELQTQSEKMGLAKHQLFILDACYGGLFAMRSGGVDAAMPNYIHEITRRTARQVMTAGGSDQQVLDGGPGGHSVFTGHMLQAVREGLADNNADGYVTFAELTSYVVPRASNQFQTPAFSSLPGHGNGEFVFAVNSAAQNVD